MDKTVYSFKGAEGRGPEYKPGGAGGPCTALQRDRREAAHGHCPSWAWAARPALALPPVHAKGNKEAKEEEEDAEHHSCSHHARNQGCLCGDRGRAEGGGCGAEQDLAVGRVGTVGRGPWEQRPAGLHSPRTDTSVPPPC